MSLLIKSNVNFVNVFNYVVPVFWRFEFGFVFHVAFGELITINYLWESLRIAAKSELKAIYGPPRQGDVRDSLANISKAEKLLGYKPKYTVREGLKITWDYFN